MRVRTLFLEQFRNYERTEISFGDSDVHIFVGPNGAGKTNILEAIGFLSVVKSLIGATDEEVVHWGREYFRVRGEFRADTEEVLAAEVVSQFLPRRGKACFLNDVRTGVSSMVGSVPVVAFLPQDLELFTGAPANRRSLIDRVLSQVSPAYLELLTTYQKTLKQRNALLKRIAQGIASEEDLLVWDTKVAEAGAEITLQRLELLEVLQCTLSEELRSFGEQWKESCIIYERKGNARDRTAAQEELLHLLRDCRKRDIILQSTTVGPHRDDWTITVEGRSIASFASRGQQRTAVLALLSLQISYVQLRRGERPVVLLDDVFSELDDVHQTSLLTSLPGYQTLITATHAPVSLEGAALWQVERGSVFRADAVRA